MYYRFPWSRFQREIINQFNNYVMKRILLITLFVFLAFFYSNAQQSSFSVCGVSMAESPESFLEKLVQKGFVKESEKRASGTFCGVSGCRIFLNPYSDINSSCVSRVEINLPTVEFANSSRFQCLSEMYLAKYGKCERIVEYDSGLSDRVEILVWNLANGQISLKFSQDGYSQSVSITYIDYSSVKKLYVLSGIKEI